jgi:hypothetical protein
LGASPIAILVFNTSMALLTNSSTRIRRVGNGGDLPSLLCFDELPGLAASVLGFTVNEKYVIEVNAGDSSVGLDLNVSVLRV